MADEVPVRVPNRAVTAAYDRIAALYDVGVGPFEAATVRRALGVLGPRPGESVLDVGCGPGHALVALARRVGVTGRAVGLDAAPGMVDRALHRCRSTGVDASVLLGDARSLPVRDDAFDAALLADTLELFSATDRGAVLSELRRALGRDGRLCVVTMERAGHEDDAFYRAYEWGYRHVPGYDRVGCRPVYAARALREAGFAVEERTSFRRVGVWPTTVLLARPD